MQFYDTTTKKGICQEIDFICDSDDTNYPRLDKTRRVNSSFEELVGEIINADGTWQHDDTNYTDSPRGKGTLVEGQEYYSFAAEYLQVEAIDILDKNNLYRRIKPYDPNDSEDSPEEHWGVDSSGNPAKGFPEAYDIKGDSIRLYPAPTSTLVTLANGLRISFKRKPSLFTAVSTTAEDTTEPGLPSSYHILLAYMASVPYCLSYKKDRVAWLEKKITEMKKTLLEHFAYREKNKRAIIRTKQRIFK
mgnify:CR=1 FL=1